MRNERFELSHKTDVAPPFSESILYDRPIRTASVRAVVCEGQPKLKITVIDVQNSDQLLERLRHIIYPTKGCHRHRGCNLSPLLT